MVSFKLLSAQHVTPFKGDYPIMFVDSVRTNSADMQGINPNSIATVTIYKESATKILPEAIGGLVYVETKKFAKSRFQRFFKFQSKNYADLLLSYPTDDDIQYILNGKVLTENYEGDLASITKTTFKSLSVISANELINSYNVTNKKVGVVIISEMVIKTIPEIMLR